MGKAGSTAREGVVVEINSSPCVVGAEAILPPLPALEGHSWRTNEAEGLSRFNWLELWSYRELLYFLMWKEVKVRYKQTMLGVAWAVIQPVMTMIVFSIFFGRLAGLGHQTGGVPYPIYVYTALLPWTFFASSISSSSSSLVGNVNLITKVYFPRLIIPLGTIFASLVDLAISFGVLILMMVGYHTPITWHILLIPLLLVGVILAAGGVGLLFGALTVTYRDFRYVVPFTLQLWMFATPVIYPSSIVPHRWQQILALNPMAGLIDGFRAALLNARLDWTEIGTALGVSLLLFLGGVTYFRRVERRFADVI